MMLKNRYMMLMILISLNLANNSAYGLSTQDFQYNVFLDGDKIGYHRVNIKPVDSRKIVQVEAGFNVKFLIFNAYQYKHSANEEWEGGCLTNIQTSTNDNGAKLFVNGTQQNDAFIIKSPNGSRSITGCVKSFAYWDPRLLQATHLLNTQNGEYTPVKTLRLDEEEISLGQQKVIARNYRIVSDQFVIDLWYSADEEWLALSTTTESGANLRYERRQED